MRRKKSTSRSPHVNREVGVEADEGRRLEEKDDLDPEQVALPHVLPEPAESPGRPLSRRLQHEIRFLPVLARGFAFGWPRRRLTLLMSVGHVLGHARNIVVRGGCVGGANFQIGHGGGGGGDA